MGSWGIVEENNLFDSNLTMFSVLSTSSNPNSSLKSIQQAF
jgi:hypothetical protein